MPPKDKTGFPHIGGEAYEVPKKNEKKTVVILAESPRDKKAEDIDISMVNYLASRGAISLGDPRAEHQLINRNWEFAKQAKWWKDEHPEHNVVIIPFYKDWEGNDIEDAMSRIKDIDGNVSVAFMGHSGTSFGGTPISKVESTKELRYKSGGLSREFKYRRQNIDTEQELSEFLNQQFSNYGGKTISEHVVDLGDKVTNVIVGGCAYGSSYPYQMQALSIETGKDVFCQHKGSWGTDAIVETGKNPEEQFFVGGWRETKMGVETGGMVFHPDSNPEFIDESRTGQLKEIHSKGLEEGTLTLDPKLDYAGSDQIGPLGATLSGVDLYQMSRPSEYSADVGEPVLRSADLIMNTTLENMSEKLTFASEMKRHLTDKEDYYQKKLDDTIEIAEDYIKSVKADDDLYYNSGTGAVEYRNPDEQYETVELPEYSIGETLAQPETSMEYHERMKFVLEKMEDEEHDRRRSGLYMRNMEN